MVNYINEDDLEDRFGCFIESCQSARFLLTKSLDYDILCVDDMAVNNWSIMIITVWCDSRDEWNISKTLKVNNSVLNSVFDFVCKWIEAKIVRRC